MNVQVHIIDRFTCLNRGVLGKDRYCKRKPSQLLINNISMLVPIQFQIGCYVKRFLIFDAYWPQTVLVREIKNLFGSVSIENQTHEGTYAVVL